ncbi:MAG TPA: helical backbone metal receptor [Terracidiphilus sp.]|nr:helical backbone metal receptor [Terracidiphilus sp.]
MRLSSILALCLTICCAQARAIRVVTDELGRTVSVPDHPHRLICLLPSVVDDVYALGAAADVIAVSDYTKYPAEAHEKPSVGPPLSPSLEMIVALHADLVLGDGAMNHVETLSRLQQMGIPVFMVDPHGVAGIYRSLNSLGHALNRDDAARNLIARLHQREAAVRARVQGKSAIRVLMPVWYDPVVTIGSHAYITELIELAGGHSITSDIPQEWPQLSLEAVLARSPEALLLVRGSKMSVDAVKNRPGWSELPAVRNNRVYYVGDEINYPSPVAFDALEELAKEFHP